MTSWCEKNCRNYHNLMDEIVEFIYSSKLLAMVKSFEFTSVNVDSKSNEISSKWWLKVLNSGLRLGGPACEQDMTPWAHVSICLARCRLPATTPFRWVSSKMCPLHVGSSCPRTTPWPMRSRICPVVGGFNNQFKVQTRGGRGSLDEIRIPAPQTAKAAATPRLDCL